MRILKVKERVNQQKLNLYTFATVLALGAVSFSFNRKAYGLGIVFAGVAVPLWRKVYIMTR